MVLTQPRHTERRSTTQRWSVLDWLDPSLCCEVVRPIAQVIGKVR